LSSSQHRGEQTSANTNARFGLQKVCVVVGPWEPSRKSKILVLVLLSAKRVDVSKVRYTNKLLLPGISIWADVNGTCNSCCCCNACK
jgi:hypothetical protein